MKPRNLPPPLPPSLYGLGVNWGTRATHQLTGDIVVRLLKDNGFDKVKLFKPNADALQALGNYGIQVMLVIPYEFLQPLSTSVQAVVEWVRQNVSTYISRYGVDIRCIVVGNEPFLNSYKGMFEQTTFPALKNIQVAFINIYTILDGSVTCTNRVPKQPSVDK